MTVLVSLVHASPSTYRGDEACRVALGGAQPKSQGGEGPNPTDFPRRAEAAWRACQGADVDPVLEATAAMLSAGGLPKASRRDVLNVFATSLERLRKARSQSLGEAQLLARIASLQYELGEPGEARASLEEALQKRIDYFGPTSVEAAFGMVNLGTTVGYRAAASKNAGELANALAMVEDGVKILVDARGADDATAARARVSTVDLYRTIGDEAMATKIEEWFSDLWDRQSREERIAAQEQADREWR